MENIKAIKEVALVSTVLLLIMMEVVYWSMFF